MTSGTALWYLTRGSGVVALLLLTATTLLGVLTAGRWRSERWPRFAVAALHRNLTLVGLVFIGIHVGTTIADGYAPIGIKDVFVPFTSQYRPVWLGFGALTLDLLLAIVVSSALRKHIGYRTWRVLHWGAYAAWPLAIAHGLGSGSDARYGWMAVLTVACLALVIISVAVRLYQSRTPALQVLAGAATLGLAVLLGSWYAGGPGQRGWAARAGTPKSLLKSSASSAVAAAAGVGPGRQAGHPLLRAAPRPHVVVRPRPVRRRGQSRSRWRSAAALPGSSSSRSGAARSRTAGSRCPRAKCRSRTPARAPSTTASSSGSRETWWSPT